MQFLCRLALADANRFRGRLELGKLKLTKKLREGNLTESLLGWCSNPAQKRESDKQARTRDLPAMVGLMRRGSWASPQNSVPCELDSHFGYYGPSEFESFWFSVGQQRSGLSAI